MHKDSSKKRILGDEWKNWDGSYNEPVDVRAGNKLFLTLLFLSVLSLISISFFILYLITPRLSQYSERLPYYAVLIISGMSFLCILWFLAVLFISRTQSRKFCICLGNRFFFELSAFASRVGKKLGISKDRVGHSFIKVSNAVNVASLKDNLHRKVLILLPRCLSHESRTMIFGICANYSVEIKTASGGESARRHVMEYLPDAVIGIACERDLVSGIRDVASKIPVFGIPNIRPDGPCKGTHIDYEELANTLKIVCA